MSDRLKAIRDRLEKPCIGREWSERDYEDIDWLVSEAERLSRIEAAAVAYRDTYRRYDLAAENGTPLEWAEAGSDESEAMAALFATLPSSEETSRG